MRCSLCEVVAQVSRGEHAHAVATLSHCVVILGENQGCRGWCVLVLREHIEHVDELAIPIQQAIFAEVALVARAIRAEFGPIRINYECLGNVVPHVHWHVIPRHADDPTPRQPVWGWSQEELRGELSHDDRRKLASAIRGHIGQSMAGA
jgi:diadenosine tetraphosphate (Ap4A) HIT family hydrolase